MPTTGTTHGMHIIHITDTVGDIIIIRFIILGGTSLYILITPQKQAFEKGRYAHGDPAEAMYMITAEAAREAAREQEAVREQDTLHLQAEEA